MNRLPGYFRQELPEADVHRQLNLFKSSKINTVCVSAHCPNLTSCFKAGSATFMLLGDICTRNCAFCAVDKSGGANLPLDIDEPRRIASVAAAMQLKYVVLTSVTRDDLEDGGVNHFVKTIELLRESIEAVKIEALIPDLEGKSGSLKKIVESQPDVLAHNIETVPRLYTEIRPMADYRRSLGLLSDIKLINSNIVTKSSLLLGLGEREEEVIAVMRDLLQGDCDILTLGQYLKPSSGHYPVKEFINPQLFDHYRDIALSLGFGAVLSGPLVRSSYKAQELYRGLVCTT